MAEPGRGSNQSLGTAQGKTKVLAGRVHGALRHDILTWALPPKTRLDESSLVARFDMSRTPIREALRRLSLEGLVEIRPHSGASVTAFDIENVVEYFEVVQIVQKAVLVLAAHRRTDEEVVTAEAAQATLEAASDREEANSIPLLNRNFHEEIARASHNDRLIAYCGRLLDDGMRLAFLPLQNYIASDWQREMASLITDHRELLSGIRDQNADWVARVSDRHIQLFKDQVMAALASQRAGVDEAARLASTHLQTGEDHNA